MMHPTDEARWELEMTAHLAEHDLAGLLRDHSQARVTTGGWVSWLLLAVPAVLAGAAGVAVGWWLP